MEKRVTRIYLAVLFIGILCAVFSELSLHRSTGAENRGVVVWDSDMEVSREGDVYCYRHRLPPEDTDGKVIVYNTVHMYLEVRVDGNTVYELKAGKDGGTTGVCWNVIPLSQQDAGREIVFRVTPVYSDSKPTGVFYYGGYQEIERRILAGRIFRLFLMTLIALAGLILLFYGILVVKRGKHAEPIVQFGIFAVLLGIWSILETQVLDWLFPGSRIIVYLTHLTLMIMPIPFILFLRNMYHNPQSRLWSGCCYMNCAVITVRVFLQLAGICDLRETLLLTHISFLIIVAVIVWMTIRETMLYGFSGRVRMNSICVLVIVLSTVLELAIYRLCNVNTPLGSMGFLFYITVMGIANVRRTRELMEQARESEIYRKLAFTDELTGLANRTAFREDLEERMEPDKASGRETILPTVVYMFDLNDLKKCNDTYGHDYGDQYIKMSADILKKLFAQKGKCYRIGGDEFCAWMPYTSMEEVHEKLQQLEREVRELNEKGFVVTVSIAAGYAVYAEGEDGGGLYSTMKRADAMMYEKKQEYKRQGVRT